MSLKVSWVLFIVVDFSKRKGNTGLLFECTCNSPLHIREYSWLDMLSGNEGFESHSPPFFDAGEVFKCLRTIIASWTPIRPASNNLPDVKHQRVLT